MCRRQALLEHNMAPLCTRRDIALLGLIQRTVFGKGPPHFQQFFRRRDSAGRLYTRADVRRHHRQLEDPRDGSHSVLLSRSAIGLISVYNMLPADIVGADNVSTFQQGLQNIVKKQARAGVDGWELTLSPRTATHTHPLQRL